MRIGVPVETVVGERRVALAPDSVGRLVALGIDVSVQRGAGAAAHYPDAAYADAGATLADDPCALLRESDVVVKIRPPSLDEAALLSSDAVLIALLQPESSGELLARLAERGVTSFSLERVPRITRAQSMDVLSSQSTVAGYEAVLVGAGLLPKFLPMLTTAAGTIAPAHTFVIGAGVAGLQAIATARRLGAQIEGYDVRPETREQIESLGAKFLDLGVNAAGSGGYARELSADERAAQQQALAEHLKGLDVVVTTAAIPGRPAPKILTAAMVEGMKPGALIVDLAAEGGGNCELTRPGERVEHGGVVILGPLHLAAGAPLHASEMYARNIFNFLALLVDDGALHMDFDDELVDKSCISHAGETRLAR